MLSKIKKFFSILKYYFMDSDNLLLYLMLIKANESLKKCYELHISSTEEFEDLIFHIKAYLEIPKILIATKYPEFDGLFNIKSMLRKYRKKKLSKIELSLYEDYILDIEKQRAVEREFIFECSKALSFGFEF